MQEELRTVRLYGKLGAMFGRVHRLAVSSAAEAVRALCVICPGFERELCTSKDRGVGYVCYLDKLNIPTADALNFPAGNATIRIAPVYTGSKRNGIGQIIVGIIIIVAAVWTGGAAGAAAGAGGAGGAGAAAGGASFLGVTGGYAMAAQLGAAMMLGGVMQMLGPQAKGLSTKDGPDNGSSYNMNGVANTTAQGACVPLPYGDVIVGSAVISAGIYAEDQQ